MSLVIIIGVIIAGFLWWGQHLFNRLSLENNGRFLLFANYRLALLLVFTGFMIVAISFSDLIRVPMSIVGFYPTHLTLTIRLVMAVLTGIVSWLFGRWIIYRPDHFKTIFSFKGLND